MNLSMNTKEKRESGFTLLELLIVVSIIAILSVALVLVLNPAEALKKSRDAQRLSDMSTMKTALGLYLTSTSTPYLGANAAGALNNTWCKATPSIAPVSPAKIFYSLPTAVGTISQATLDGASTYAAAQQSASVAAATVTDGSGWIPVAFDNLVGGSPLSNLPIDPVNAFGSGHTGAAVDNTDLMYRYACSVTPLAFEIDAALESSTYATGADSKLTSDGGNNSNFYEVGTNLKILGTGNNF